MTTTCSALPIEAARAGEPGPQAVTEQANTLNSLKFSITQSQRGQYEQVQDGGGEQAAEDYDGHWAFDFAASFAGPDGQRQQAERGDEGGHQDGEQALGSAADGGVESPGHAFGAHEVIEVGDHHDRVARADAEEGDEADERAEGERAASGEDGQHAADESEGKVGQHEEQVARVAKDDAEQQDDADARDGGVPEQFAFSA